MNTTRTLSCWGPLTIATVMIAATGAAFAAEESPGMPSQEMREKMAAVHEKMAACLRSEKPFADCRNEMQQNCQTMKGEQGCPMMGMDMGKGTHDRMKKTP